MRVTCELVGKMSKQRCVQGGQRGCWRQGPLCRFQWGLSKDCHGGEGGNIKLQDQLNRKAIATITVMLSVSGNFCFLKHITPDTFKMIFAPGPTSVYDNPRVYDSLMPYVISLHPSQAMNRVISRISGTSSTLHVSSSEGGELSVLAWPWTDRALPAKVPAPFPKPFVFRDMKNYVGYVKKYEIKCSAARSFVNRLAVVTGTK